MFSGCPSIRESRYREISRIRLGGFIYHTCARGAPCRIDELIRMWARSAKVQRSKVNELGLNMLCLPHYRDISRTPG